MIYEGLIRKDFDANRVPIGTVIFSGLMCLQSTENSWIGLTYKIKEELRTAMRETSGMMVIHVPPSNILTIGRV